MSMAPCFADTNDPALDPATTAEDTQHTLQSIVSHTGLSLLLAACLAIRLTASLLLSLIPIFHPSLTCVIRVPYRFPFCNQRCYLSLPLLPHTLSISLSIPLIHSLSFLFIHSVHLNLFLSLFHPSPTTPQSFSLSPANSFIVLGSG